jgi:hydroxyacylglutathione hydrolase
MLLRQIFDSQLAQYAYLIGCPRSGEALIIDPERDIDRYREIARENGLRITAVAETHIHADFVSGAQEFASDSQVNLYLSAEGGTDWTYQWSKGRANVTLLRDGDTFKVGNIRVEAVHTPGHTPEHISFLITDLGAGADEPIALATGDFLFMGDVGRPDLLESAAGVKDVMEPSARTLQNSLIERLKSYGDYLQILPGHGAGSACGKSLGAVPTTTLGYERRYNAPFKRAISDREGFVKEILQGQPDPPRYFATMKRVNRDGIAVTGDIPRPQRMSPVDLKARLASRAVTVLDTRDTLGEFHSGHVAGAIAAPLHSPFFSNSAGSYIEAGEPVVLVVKHDQDVEVASRQLYRIGIDSIVGWISFAEAREAGLCDTVTQQQNLAKFSALEVSPDGLVVDVRMAGEHKAGHIPGALSIPYTRLRERLAELPADRPLFVHCASGKRAALATAFLGSRGFKVTHLDGDIAGYLERQRAK